MSISVKHTVSGDICVVSFRDQSEKFYFLHPVYVLSSSLHFMPGLLEEVADITMATWQTSRDSEQQSLMLPTSLEI